MACIICNSKNVDYYFTTIFEGKIAEFLDKSEYHRCKECGFTFSKTLFEMDYMQWSKLNVDLHSYHEDLIQTDLAMMLGNQPPYLAQADMINLLIKNDIIESNFGNTMGGGG